MTPHALSTSSLTLLQLQILHTFIDITVCQIIYQTNLNSYLHVIICCCTYSENTELYLQYIAMQYIAILKFMRYDDCSGTYFNIVTGTHNDIRAEGKGRSLQRPHKRLKFENTLMVVPLLFLARTHSASLTLYGTSKVAKIVVRHKIVSVRAKGYVSQ